MHSEWFIFRQPSIHNASARALPASYLCDRHLVGGGNNQLLEHDHLLLMQLSVY